jgi:hypothetical protein
MAERKKRIGRPTKPGTAGQRVSLGLRVMAETKRKLEAAAIKSGRSQSQEAEFRIEQSFLKEEVYGGKELNGLLMLMVGAAEIIQARTGKSWSSDWDTFVMAQAAWKRLGVAAGPLPPKEWREALLEASKASTTIHLEPPPEDAERSVRAAYLTESAKKIAAISAFYRYQEIDRAQEMIGEDVAAELLPRREAVMQTAIPAQRVEKTKEK